LRALNLKIIFASFLIIYFFIGIYLSINTGISHDEFHEQLNWEVNISSIKSFLLEGEYNNLLNYKDRYHGIGFHYISQPFQTFLSGLISNILEINFYGGVLISKHIIVFTLFFISSLFFYLICKQLFKDRFFSITSTVIFLLYPYLFGHSQFNPKDIPFLSLWIISTYLTIKIFNNLVNQKKIYTKTIILLSLSTSLLISIRIVGFLILLQYLIFMLTYVKIENKKFLKFLKLYKKEIIIFLTSLAILLYLLNPIFWHNPLEILNSLKWMSKYQQDVCTLTLGDCLKSLSLPASYYFIWLSFKLPILVILGFLIFPFLEKKISKNKFNQIVISSLIITIITILFLFIFLNVAIYDELRHVMFLIPLIFIVSFHNIYFLNKKIFLFLGTLLVLFFIFENKSLNPYQYTWLNSFSKLYNINKNFETDYWGISSKKLFYSINNYASKNKVSKDACVYGGTYSKVYLENKNFTCLKLYTELDAANNRPFFVVKNVRNFKRSDPKDCKLIANENYKYTFSKQNIIVGSSWYCD
jgi:hypothetical protein